VNDLRLRCPNCNKLHEMGNYTWAEIVAECGGEPPICPECGVGLAEPGEPGEVGWARVMAERERPMREQGQ
jgi:hypothetical protein